MAFNYILLIFPIQIHVMGKICWPGHKIGQGHDLNKLCRAPVPDAKFQKSKAFWFLRRTFLKVFAIYSHGGHLRMLHMTFGFDWPNGFRAEDL